MVNREQWSTILDSKMGVWFGVSVNACEQVCCVVWMCMCVWEPGMSNTLIHTTYREGNEWRGRKS